MNIRRTVYFSGRVQGVGFRFTTVRIAAKHTVGGSVRNLPDGRVELLAEGTPEELERFVAAIHQELDPYITGTTGGESPASGTFTEFGIGY